MPKSKKSKIVSLVSAYAEDDEDSNQSATESDEEASDDNESSVRSCSASHSSQGDKDEKPADRSGGDLSGVEESTTASSKSPPRAEPSTSGAAGSAEKEGETGQLAEADSGAVEDIEASMRIKYTLENGFPPGCDQIRLPPAPKAPCSQTLQTKIIQVVERMHKYGYSINDEIERKKKFRNPSIYEKLIEAHDIDEYGSNFPTYVDLKSQNYMFYDELDKVQQEEWARKEKERKERTKIEMVSGTKKKL